MVYPIFALRYFDVSQLAEVINAETFFVHNFESIFFHRIFLLKDPNKIYLKKRKTIFLKNCEF